MDAHDVDLIPAGTVFSPADIIHYADPDMRDLAQAISDADVLVSAPHAGAAIPEELAGFLSPDLTRRLQVDFSDIATAAVVKRWAEIDPRIVAVINPHPRLMRDPNRVQPFDLRADVREAFDRVRAAGPRRDADLTGVDAVRPVTYSSFHILSAPRSDVELARLVETLSHVASQGLDVYEATREELTDLFITKVLAQGGAFTRLSFHDSMHAPMRADGALNDDPAVQAEMPAVVALSNYGDEAGEQCGAADPVTMAPVELRRLAEAHRREFEVAEPEAVTLNRPYRGGHEILDAAERFARVSAETGPADASFAAVQAEFSRAYVLGPRALEELSEPGEAWVEEDHERIEFLAYACKRAWDAFRDGS